MDAFCQKTEGQMHMINMISSGVNQILPLSTDLTTDLLPAHLWWWQKLRLRYQKQIFSHVTISNYATINNTINKIMEDTGHAKDCSLSLKVPPYRGWSRYLQLPNFSGQACTSIGKSSRCMGHSAWIVSLQDKTQGMIRNTRLQRLPPGPSAMTSLHRIHQRPQRGP